MKALIFAAGLGSRFKPITNKIPKALVKVGGKTLLQYNIERLIEFGITNIVINVHHYPEQIIEFLKSHNYFNINIQISDESGFLLDTGGGLKKAACLLKGGKPVLLQNVDIYSNIDYDKMLKQHIESDSLATLAVQNRESDRYLMFNSNNELSGWVNIKTNEQIVTRTNNTTKNLSFSGIHIISNRLLNMLPNKTVFSIIEFYLELSKTQTISGYLHNNNYWFDVGSPERLEKLEQFLRIRPE